LLRVVGGVGEAALSMARITKGLFGLLSYWGEPRGAGAKQRAKYCFQGGKEARGIKYIVYQSTQGVQVYRTAGEINRKMVIAVVMSTFCGSGVVHTQKIQSAIQILDGSGEDLINYSQSEGVMGIISLYILWYSLPKYNI
jgi:hypothetical protein